MTVPATGGNIPCLRLTELARSDFGRQFADVRSHPLHALLHGLQVLFLRRALHLLLDPAGVAPRPKNGLPRVWPADPPTEPPLPRPRPAAPARAAELSHIATLGRTLRAEVPESTLQLSTAVNNNSSRLAPCSAIATQLSFQRDPLALFRSPELCCNHVQAPDSWNLPFTGTFKDVFSSQIVRVWKSQVCMNSVYSKTIIYSRHKFEAPPPLVKEQSFGPTRRKKPHCRVRGSAKDLATGPNSTKQENRAHLHVFQDAFSNPTDSIIRKQSGC